MECIEAIAFKSSSFFLEVEMKPSIQPASLEADFGCAAAAAAGGVNGGFTSGDDFSVDEYFNLSAGEGFQEGDFEGEGGDEEEKRSSSSSSSSSSLLSLSSQDQIDEGSSFPAGFNGDALVSGSLSTAAELAIPVDDMKELEIWSHLMDETVSDEFIAYPSGPSPFKPDPNSWKRVPTEPEVRLVQPKAVDFASDVPAKPRTKRSRKPGPAWHQLPHLKPEPSSFSEESTTFVFITSPVQEIGEFLGAARKPAKKKQKRKPVLDTGVSLTGPLQLRRCTHCQVQRTPQWRTGPLGPKTLCNACGVRFKSGRLFPEYRPACSPTFSSEIHSNSHRKVLEMRRKKEMGAPAVPSLAPTTVLSC